MCICCLFFFFGFRLFSVWFIQGYMLFFNASGCSFSPITHRFWDGVGWTFLFGDLAVLSLLYSPTLKCSVLSTLYIPLLSEFIKAPKLHIIWAFKTWVKLCQWWFGRCVKKWRCSRAQRTFFKQQVPSPYNPLKLIPKSFLVSPVRFSFRWTLNFISWTLLERLQGNNKRSVLTSSNTGLIMLVQFFSRFKKECNKICFFP